MADVTEAMIAAGNQVVIDSPWFDIDQAALNQAGFVRAIYLAMQSAAPSQGEVKPPRWTSAVPMVRTERGTWSKVHYDKDGNIGRDIEPNEADAIGAFRFYMLAPDSDLARAAISAMKGEGE